MTAPDPAAVAVFDDLVRTHAGAAGASALSRFHIEVCTMIATLTLAASRDGDAGALLRNAEVIEKLTKLLPVPAVAADTFRLERLTDAELTDFERLLARGRDEAAPEWTPDVPTPKVGVSELRGSLCGKYIDEHVAEWAHRALTADEANELRTRFGMMAQSAFIVRDLWAELYRSELESQIEAAVAAALKAINSDAAIVPLSAEEKQAQLEPPQLAPPPFPAPGSYPGAMGRHD